LFKKSKMSDTPPPQLDGPFYDTDVIESEWLSDDSPPPLDGPFLGNEMGGAQVQVNGGMAEETSVQVNIYLIFG
jgi:hypothetical protein